MLYLFIIISILITLAGAYFYWLFVPAPDSYAYKGELTRKTIAAGNLERTYLVYTPACSSPDDLPLVIVLHGTGINGEKIRTWTGYDFDRLADQYNFRVVYPDAIGGHWNDLRSEGSFRSKKENIGDVDFIKAIADRYRGARSNGIFAFGYSNGGVMLYRIMAEHPALFDALAISGANVPAKANRLAEIAAPAPPLLLVSGTKDPIIPYDGGTVKLFGRNLGEVMGAKETAAYYAATHGTLYHDTGDRKSELAPHDATRLHLDEWNKGSDTKVKLHTVENGGHVVPSAHAVFPRLMGKITKKLDAVQEAIVFFGLNKKHRRDPE